MITGAVVVLGIFAIAGYGLSRFFPKGGHSLWGLALCFPTAYALWLMDFAFWPEVLLMTGLGSSLFSTSWAICDMGKGDGLPVARKEGVPEFVAHLEKPAFRVVLGLIGIAGFSVALAIFG